MAQPTAIRIDSLGEYPTFVSNQYGAPGPYLKPSTSEWYYIGAELDDSSNLNLAAYKSSNSGTSWTKVAVGPQIRNAGIGIACPFYPGSGTTIHVAYQDNSYVISYTTFDMVTGFGAAISKGADSTEDASTTITVWAILDESGNPLIAWDVRRRDPSTGFLQKWEVRASIISGGSFGTMFVVASEQVSRNFLLEVAGKSATYVQILCSHWDATFSFRDSVSLVKIVGGAVSSTFTLATDPSNWWLNRAPSGPPIYDSANNKLGFPIVEDYSFTHDEVRMVVVSDPEGTPSDSNNSVYVASSDDIADLYPPVVAAITAGFRIFWRQESPPPFTIGETIRYSSCATLEGTWSADTIYFDLNQSGLSPSTLAAKIRGNFAGVINGSPKIVIGLTSPTLWLVDMNYYDEQFIQFYLSAGPSAACRYRAIQ